MQTHQNMGIIFKFKISIFDVEYSAVLNLNEMGSWPKATLYSIDSPDSTNSNLQQCLRLTSLDGISELQRANMSGMQFYLYEGIYLLVSLLLILLGRCRN